MEWLALHTVGPENIPWYHILIRNWCIWFQELLAHVNECSKTGSPVDIGQLGFTTTLNQLANTILSVDLSDAAPEAAKELKEMIWQVMVGAGKPNIADYFPMLKGVDPQSARRRMTGYYLQMTDIFERIINKRDCKPERSLTPTKRMIYCIFFWTLLRIRKRTWICC